jgi:hypothetical protein
MDDVGAPFDLISEESVVRALSRSKVAVVSRNLVMFAIDQ